MQYLKQSTAAQSVLIGPFLDDADGKTAETELTIANTDIRLSKNGGNMAAKNSGGGTHDELGYYTITLDATDTATVGRLQLAVHMSGALPVYHEFTVLEEAIYDALIAASATGLLPANVTQWKGQAAATVDTNGYPKVTLKTGSGAGELDVTSGVVKSNLVAILGTALTETAGQIAAAFKKFFDVASPTGTVNSLPAAAPDAAGGLPVSDAGGLDLDAILARIGASSESPVATIFEKLEAGSAGITTSDILNMVFESTDTFQDFLRLASSVLYRKGTDLDTTSPKFRDASDAKDRVAASIATGTRTTTLDPD